MEEDIETLEAKLSAPVDQFGREAKLSVRLRNALSRMHASGIVTVADLLRLGAASFLNEKNIGAASLLELEAALLANGLDWGPGPNTKPLFVPAKRP